MILPIKVLKKTDYPIKCYTCTLMQNPSKWLHRIFIFFEKEVNGQIIAVLNATSDHNNRMLSDYFLLFDSNWQEIRSGFYYLH
ncbi:MAG: hypothetical protein JWP12_3750 [Bacteroidetes bacterium]|nr:hypothetical protein [Bacteroidota bacterium]